MLLRKRLSLLGKPYFALRAHQAHCRVDDAPSNPKRCTHNQAIAKVRKSDANSIPDCHAYQLGHAHQQEHRGCTIHDHRQENVPDALILRVVPQVPPD